MKVLITGMSGTGKSSVVAALKDAGHHAIDLDEDGWSGWAPCEGNPTGANPGHDWVWNEERLFALFAAAGDAPLFVAGCAPNMQRFIQRFERILLLTAPIDVILARVRSRRGNPYGKMPEEAARIRENLKAIEPRLRRIATHEIRTTQPLSTVVDAVLTASGQTPIGVR